MFRKLERQQREYERGLDQMLGSAIKLAGSVIACAPDRAVTADELLKIRDFVLTTIANEARDRLAANGPSKLALIASDAVAARFKEDFASRFQALHGVK